ncbi:MAG: hypothetical protein COU35_03735 [Candidatus Magasanikbacteria bacterium CG10_big_fil_rev_8_21_14_0_10_47_10]|uniref:Penicillin-binding protein 2 n=1 Tax=Candidatus Magasanikbacteria bacterium CG10_big_fil_rev_8_21_14_0_10_47_10 TaxID=1974652 RepID=A0A2H0TPR9_9BACT|nr:MAG: hypothetical protein COU35_03735 [Candidatus Magasanikbacteria bacterium CG10_big_fil_rev_8_21_14_0_10_47_10]
MILSKKNNASNRASAPDQSVARLRSIGLALVVFACVIVVRLFDLMILNHAFYVQLASGAHELYAELFPKRGTVFAQDTRTAEEFPLAMNRDVFIMYADTREITADTQAERNASELSGILGYDDEKKLAVYLQLNKRGDPYEPIEQSLEEDIMKTIEDKQLPGIHFIRKPQRYYPEGRLASQVMGFVGKTDEGTDVGRYGLEGYWQRELAGTGGFFEGIRSAKGKQIPLAGRIFQEAEDGADLLLTIDRTIQFQSCEILRKAMDEYGAQSASLIVMEPYTGAILAMCSLPDFNPNQYNEAESIDVFNNTSIFTAYEPGSVFKPVAMSAAINENIVQPGSVFHDNGFVEAGCTKPIRNSSEKEYGDQTMTGVLENSINTGMVYVVNQLGKEKFVEYIQNFGFGVKKGIGLDTEGSGTIDTLYEKKGNDIDCYTATASFGQGITVTPLQMVTAFGAIANGGKLMKPYIVEEIRYKEGQKQGKIERTKPEVVREVLSGRAASLVAGMLVSVIDSGQAGAAAVPGYYVAGKTGTAQIAGPGGYSEDTNHSFVGFAPVDEPAFVMIVKFEKPQRAFSVSTAAPVFSQVASFILKYYNVPPAR